MSRVFRVRKNKSKRYEAGGTKFLKGNGKGSSPQMRGGGFPLFCGKAEGSENTTYYQKSANHNLRIEKTLKRFRPSPE